MNNTHFKKIALNHKDLIYSQAFYFTNNKEDAEDITQEVLIKLWHHLESIGQSQVKSWLLRVTRNKCIDHSRKKRESNLDDPDALEIGCISVWDEQHHNPEEEFIHKNLMENLTNVINQLPEKIRSILIMRDIQDLTYGVIAESMNIPINSVKVYLHRGRKLLLKKITKYDFQAE